MKKKEEEKIYSEKDLIEILNKLGMTTESDDNCECDCDCCDEDDDIEIGYPCNLTMIPKYDNEKFQSGVDNVSEICGSITALRNTGISFQMAVEIIMNLKAMEAELKAMDVSAKTSVEVSKNTSIAIEKTQI